MDSQSAIPIFNEVHPSGAPPVWMHLYLKLHMELSLLAFLRIRQWEAAEDLASDCLIAAWSDAASKETVAGFSKEVLLKRLQRCCEAFVHNEKNRTIAEEQFSLSGLVSPAQNSSFEDRTEQIIQYARFLDTTGATIIRLILEEDMDLTAISTHIDKPLSTIQLHYDRTIYYLKKRFAPTSLAVYPLG